MTDSSKVNVNRYLGKALLVALGILSTMIVQVVIPSMHPATTGSQIDLVAGYQSNVQRISKLEAVVYKLENIPIFVATQTEAISNLKASVDKIGEKLDRHIGREVRNP